MKSIANYVLGTNWNLEPGCGNQAPDSTNLLSMIAAKTVWSSSNNSGKSRGWMWNREQSVKRELKLKEGSDYEF